MLFAVYQRTELYTVLLYFVGNRKAEYLESAGVGQYGLVPAHERMQAARLAHKLVPGALKQMVCIGKAYLAARVRKVPRGHCLNGGLRTHGHIAGRVYNAVRRMQPPQPRARLRAGMYQFKTELVHLSSYVVVGSQISFSHARFVYITRIMFTVCSARFTA